MRLIKKADIILIAFLAVFAVLFLFFFKPFGTEGNVAVITVNGETYKTVSLYTDTEIEIVTPVGINTVTISSGKAWVSYADCPDGLCVRQGGISSARRLIACLPNGVIVEIRSSDDGLDGIVR